MVDKNADGTRQQGKHESSDDADIRNSIFQTSEALAEDVQQQRHENQGGNAGASCHDDTARISNR